MGNSQSAQGDPYAYPKGAEYSKVHQLEPYIRRDSGNDKLKAGTLSVSRHAKPDMPGAAWLLQHSPMRHPCSKQLKYMT